MSTTIEQLYSMDEDVLDTYVTQVFGNEPWFKAFHSCSHHGRLHSSEVSDTATKLALSLDPDEMHRLYHEGAEIYPKIPQKGFLVAIDVASYFHDCGRYDGAGNFAENQNDHPLVGAARASYFCNALGITRSILPYVHDAILCHDFKSKEMTPQYSPPKTMIGKLVQAGDQLGWFHPDSADRTERVVKEFGIPFLKPDMTIQERLEWHPDSFTGDGVSCLFAQLHGPRGPDRFGVSPAQAIIDTYRPKLRQNILLVAEKNGVRQEVEQLLLDYEAAIKER